MPTMIRLYFALLPMAVLTLFLAVSMSASAENLLMNAEFETIADNGALPAWTANLMPGTYAGLARNRSGVSGKQCLELCCPQVGQSGAISQKCSVVPGQEEDVEYFALYRHLLHNQGLTEKQISKAVNEIIVPALQSLTEWSLSPNIFELQKQILADKIHRYLHLTP